jgi:hypothetical protein
MGAGSSMRFSFCLLWLSLEFPSVESWSRSQDPIGRILRVLGSVVLAALLWWQELWLLRMVNLGISNNKAALFLLETGRSGCLPRHRSVAGDVLHLALEAGADR